MIMERHAARPGLAVMSLEYFVYDKLTIALQRVRYIQLLTYNGFRPGLTRRAHVRCHVHG